MEKRDALESRVAGVWFISASLFLCAAVPAFAETITRWTLRVYQVGAPQPLLKPIELVLGEDVTCNLDPATVETARQVAFSGQGSMERPNRHRAG